MKSAIPKHQTGIYAVDVDAKTKRHIFLDTRVKTYVGIFDQVDDDLLAVATVAKAMVEEGVGCPQVAQGPRLVH